MKFKFSLQALLQSRKQHRLVAMKEYAEAQKKVQDTMDKINSYYSDISVARDYLNKIEKNGGSVSSIGVNTEEFVQGTLHKINEEKRNVREYMTVAEEKHEQLVEATKEFKMIEHFREKKWNEFKKELSKKEQKKMDDLVTMRFGRN